MKGTGLPDTTEFSGKTGTDLIWLGTRPYLSGLNVPAGLCQRDLSCSLLADGPLGIAMVHLPSVLHPIAPPV